MLLMRAYPIEQRRGCGSASVGNCFAKPSWPRCRGQRTAECAVDSDGRPRSRRGARVDAYRSKDYPAAGRMAGRWLLLFLEALWSTRPVPDGVTLSAMRAQMAHIWRTPRRKSDGMPGSPVEPECQRLQPVRILACPRRPNLRASTRRRSQVRAPASRTNRRVPNGPERSGRLPVQGATVRAVRRAALTPSCASLDAGYTPGRGWRGCVQADRSTAAGTPRSARGNHAISGLSGSRRSNQDDHARAQIPARKPATLDGQCRASVLRRHGDARAWRS
jgi:hypothetical protein